MQEEKLIMGLFIGSFNKCAPIPGSVLETCDHPEGRHRISAGLPYIQHLTLGTMAKCITDNIVRIGDTKIDYSNNCKRT